MIRNYRYRLKPTKSQIRTFEEWMESLRLLYNFGLSDRRDAWKAGAPLNYHAQATGLPGLKTQFPRYKEVHSQVLQQTLKQLERAFKNFFEHRSGYPKFKSRDSKPSICFPQRIRIEGNRLRLPKIGIVKFKMHRSIPDGAKVKQCRITCRNGRWFATISISLPDPISEKSDLEFVGCDVGVKHLATLSDGTVLRGDRFLKQKLDRLRREQVRLSRKKTGSSNYRKQKKRIGRIHQKVADTRKDNLHKLSRRLADGYGGIAFEDMDLAFINRNRDPRYRMSSKSHDISIGTFRRFCQYKFEELGKPVVLVDPRNTTKACSACGRLVPKELGDRVHRCECGLEIDRDLNAAINIRERALKQIGREPPESKPVESSAAATANAVASAAP